MATEGVDQNKRRFLTNTTAVVGAVGAGFVAVPFLASWALVSVPKLQVHL